MAAAHADRSSPDRGERGGGDGVGLGQSAPDGGEGVGRPMKQQTIRPRLPHLISETASIRGSSLDRTGGSSESAAASLVVVPRGPPRLAPSSSSLGAAPGSAPVSDGPEPIRSGDRPAPRLRGSTSRTRATPSEPRQAHTPSTIPSPAVRAVARTGLLSKVYISGGRDPGRRHWEARRAVYAILTRLM